MKKYTLLVAALFLTGCVHVVKFPPPPPGLSEAPAGFDTLSNGFSQQAIMDADRAQFEENADGIALGPAFNAPACVGCHQTPNTGGSSQVFEHRIGPDEPSDPISAATLIHDRSTDPEKQQKAPLDAVNGLRSSLSLMGDGFVEAIPDWLLFKIASLNGGQPVLVKVLEKPNAPPRVGRFGWKDQHASLLSFSGDAECNEKGSNNRLVPCQNKSEIDDFEDQGFCSTSAAPKECEDIDDYANFIRSLKAPSRAIMNDDARIGGGLFQKIGCGNCHIPTLFTDDKRFHPFGDFLLHDVGTGDGIMQGSAPANKMRTAPLWGLRARSRLLHDGRAYTIQDAIEAHANEAKSSRKAFNKLSKTEKQQVLQFLNTL